MRIINTKFSEEKKIKFVLDDDKELNYLKKVDIEKYDRFFIFIDKNVNKIWGTKLIQKIKRKNKKIFIHEINPNEQSKSTVYLPNALDFLETNGAGRFDLIFGIGGGIVIDLVSFLCSIYMRGLPLYLIPTTLIGQVDASTAGKTCLNTKKTKNLLGTFYFPIEVYNNISFLKTCSEYYERQGLSEIFKYGLLADKKIIEILIDFDYAKMPELIYRTINARLSIRKKDALASNLGHTFGHAIEKISNFKILHGDAICSGIMLALNFAHYKGIMSIGEKNKIIELMKNIGLNLYIDDKIKPSELIRAMLRDKKSSSQNINLVLIRSIQDPYIKRNDYFYKVEPSELKIFLKKFMQQQPKFLLNNLYKNIKNKKINYD